MGHMQGVDLSDRRDRIVPNPESWRCQNPGTILKSIRISRIPDPAESRIRNLESRVKRQASRICNPALFEAFEGLFGTFWRQKIWIVQNPESGSVPRNPESRDSWIPDPAELSVDRPTEEHPTVSAEDFEAAKCSTGTDFFRKMENG